MNVPNVEHARTSTQSKDARKAHHLIDLSRLCNTQHVVMLMIAGAATGEEWTLVGTLPGIQQRALAEGRVRHTFVETVARAPGDALDVTEAMIRHSEIERGTARYVYETPVGSIAIGYQHHRYRVLIGAESYGAFATPEEAVAALADESIADFMTEAGPKLADYSVSADLRQWRVVRITAPHGGDILSTTSGNAGSVGFLQSAQQSIAQ